MSPTLFAYVARRFLETFAGAFVVVFAIVAIVNAIELLKRADDGDAGFAEVAVMATLMTPSLSIAALPFTVLLAAMTCYARLARSSELVVTRAAGLSVWGLLAPAVTAGLAVGALSVAVYNPIAAATSARFETLEARHLDGRSSRLSVSDRGLWLRQGDGRAQTVIHAEGANADATLLTGVTMFEFGPDDALTGRVDAATAALTKGAWVLTDAARREAAGPGGGLPVVERSPEMRAPTDLTSEQILGGFAPPEAISFWDLPEFIRSLETSGFSAARHRLHWHGLLAAPLLFAAMVLIGGAFSMRHARFGGLGAMALGCVLTGFGFYFVSDIARALGASGAVPLLLAAWAPPAAATLFALGLLLHLEDG